jgi:hypothetical protein
MTGAVYATIWHSSQCLCLLDESFSFSRNNVRAIPNDQIVFHAVTCNHLEQYAQGLLHRELEVCPTVGYREHRICEAWVEVRVLEHLCC